ncbi:MOSC domain-containing protein [Caballeronia sp. dw_276]|uniref:MOSC domain-containing protein n=1 Tax=Caballeronia sp. dw_276 TaxID=2719795 RepID=UPI001BD1D244|nr:MOSC domain-containing protein [Caballeronia sp. dw_276]
MNPVIDAVLAGKIAPLGTQGKRSAIHKVALAARVRVGETGLEGDHQYERRHHGGPEKALHHYSRDHYALWREEWPEASEASAGTAGLLRFDTPGAFGENISTIGMNESDVCVGDVYRMGTVIVQVSQPRQPCWKLNLHFSRDDMSRRVQDTRRTGWYYRVLEPGEVAAGDAVERLARPHAEWSIERLLRVFYVDRDDRAALEEMATLEALTPSWRSTAAKRLESGKTESWSMRLDTPAGAN